MKAYKGFNKDMTCSPNDIKKNVVKRYNKWRDK